MTTSVPLTWLGRGGGNLDQRVRSQDLLHRGLAERRREIRATLKSGQDGYVTHPKIYISLLFHRQLGLSSPADSN